MMRSRILRLPFISFLFALLTLAGCADQGEPNEEVSFPLLTGEYLGQIPSGDKPELFAPGIISTGMYTRDVAMTPDGTEFYYGIMESGFSVIMETRLENGRWTQPEVAPFSSNPRHLNIEPAISPDGQRFFFLSTRPPDGTEPPPDQFGAWVNQDIWAMDRAGNGWGEPYNLGPPVNSDAPEYFPSLTRDGTLYFTREDSETRESSIWRSRFVDGSYVEPERLGDKVNSAESQFNAFIAPDESYLILCTGGREDSVGGADYYVVFRNEDDTWSEPVNMGDAVNTPRGGEWSPYVSPDGKYFFFMSSRPPRSEDLPEKLTYGYLSEIRDNPPNGRSSIYWIDASFIQHLRPSSDS
jgi:Tol biopolymer transport system component